MSRPESGFVSGDSRSERNNQEEPNTLLLHTSSHHDNHRNSTKEQDDLCDEYLLVEGTKNLWSKLSAKKRRKLLALRLGKVTTF